MKPLRWIQKTLFVGFRLALWHPKTVLSALVLALALSVVPISRISYLLSIDDMIDADFSSTPLLNRLHSEFKEAHTFLMFFNRKDGKPLELTEACAMRRWLAKVSAEMPEVTRTFSSFSIRKPSWDGSHLWFPPVLDLECDQIKRFTLLSKDSMETLAQSPWGGILVSRDRNDLVAEISLRPVSKNGRFGSFDPEFPVKVMEDFEQTVLAKNPATQVAWTGTSAYEHFIKVGYDRFNVLNLIMVIFVIVLIRLTFGTFRAAGVFLGSIIAAAILLHGIIGVWIGSLDLLSNTLFMMLIVSTIEDFIYLSYLQIEGIKVHAHWRTSFRKLLVSTFFTSFTTIVGFGSLAASDLGIVRRFGVFAASGAFLEWLMLFIVLPSFLQLVPSWRSWVNPERAILLRWVQKITVWRIPNPLVRVLLVIFAFAAYGSFHLNLLDSPSSVFPENHPFRAVDRYFSSTRDVTGNASLVFNVPAERGKNQEILQKVSRLDNVAFSENPFAVEAYFSHGMPPLLGEAITRSWRDTEVSQRMISKGGVERAILYIRRYDVASVNRLRAEVERICSKGECEIGGTLVSYSEFGDRILTTLFSSLGLSMILVMLILVWLAWEMGHRALLPILISALWGPAAMMAVMWAFQVPINLFTCLCASALLGLTGDNTIQFLFGKSVLHESVSKLGSASILVALIMATLCLTFLFAYFSPARTLGVLMMVGFVVGLIGDYWILQGLLPRTQFRPEVQKESR